MIKSFPRLESKRASYLQEKKNPERRNHTSPGQSDSESAGVGKRPALKPPPNRIDLDATCRCSDIAAGVFFM
jgi:hypothetical protein